MRLTSVALSRPASVWPTRNDSSSVANAKSWARGMMAKKETSNLFYTILCERSSQCALTYEDQCVVGVCMRESEVEGPLVNDWL